MNGGTRANVSGKRAEKIIDCILSARGFVYERQKHLCDSIYGHRMYCDFYVVDIPEFPHGLAIESKWQGSGGSADEKFPYLVENIRTQYPCPAIIIVAGGGCKPGAEAWLRRQIDKKTLYGVFNLEEFLLWMNREVSDPIKSETPEAEPVSADQ